MFCRLLGCSLLVQKWSSDWRSGYSFTKLDTDVCTKWEKCGCCSNYVTTLALAGFVSNHLVPHAQLELSVVVPMPPLHFHSIDNNMFIETNCRLNLLELFCCINVVWSHLFLFAWFSVDYSFDVLTCQLGFWSSASWYSSDLVAICMSSQDIRHEAFRIHPVRPVCHLFFFLVLAVLLVTWNFLGPNVLHLFVCFQCKCVPRSTKPWWLYN